MLAQPALSPHACTHARQKQWGEQHRALEGQARRWDSCLDSVQSETQDRV